VVVVSDGSSDGTAAILGEFERDPQVRTVMKAESQGKAAGLNDGIQAARGEVLFFTDVRQQIERGALRFLVENFGDPDVGAASGELMLGDPASGETGKGMGCTGESKRKSGTWSRPRVRLWAPRERSIARAGNLSIRCPKALFWTTFYCRCR